MASRALPGLGLNGFWPYAEDGWHTGMDANLLTLSVVTQGAVQSRVTSLPSVPENGEIYIIPDGDAGAGDIAVRDANTWKLLSPNVGWRFWVTDEELYVVWRGDDWEVDSLTGGLQITHDSATFSIGGSEIFRADDGGVYDLEHPVVSTVTSISALRAIPPVTGKAVLLIDDIRAAIYVYDPSVTVAQAARDDGEYNTILRVPGSDGAWVNPQADRRKGLWDNSAVRATRARFNSGLLVGTEIAMWQGRTGYPQDYGSFWFDEYEATLPGVNDSRYVYTNASSVFERDGGGTTLSVLGRSHGSVGGVVTLNVTSVNRNVDVSGNGWAIYSDAVATAECGSRMRNGEFNIVNLSQINAVAGGELPYTNNSGKSLRFNMGFCVGGDATIYGNSFPADHALRFSDNGGKYHSILMIRSNALEPDIYDEGRVLAMAQNHKLEWFGPGDSRIYGIVAKGASNHWRNVVTDDLWLVSSDNGKVHFQIDRTGSAIDFLKIRAGSASASPAITADGSSTNVDILLSPKAGGRVRLATGSGSFAGTVQGTFNRTVQIKDGQGNTIELLCRIA